MILIFTMVDGEILEYPVNKTSLLIGRSNQCDIIIPFEGISRRHLQLDINGDEVTVTDLKSVNGVLIEGKKILPETPVNYPTYLNLSFGPVISLQISMDRQEVLTDPAASPAPRQKAISDSSATRVHKRPTPLERTKPQREKPSSSDLENKMVNILVVILVILAIAYFVTANP